MQIIEIMLFYKFDTEMTFLFKKRGKKAWNLFTGLCPHGALQKKPKMVSSTLLALNDKRNFNFLESYKKPQLKFFSWISDPTCSKQEDPHVRCFERMPND